MIDVLTTRYVVADTLEDAVSRARAIKMPEILGKNEWIDGTLEIVGVDEC